MSDLFAGLDAPGPRAETRRAPGAPSTAPDLSAVIPVYDEAESLPELYNRMRAAAGAAGLTYEILFIDDGSKDDTPRGRYVMTLDGDLQDDPAELPRLLTALETGGLDLVSGWKQVRHDPWTKTLPSRLFNAVTASFAGIQLHDFNCGLKLYRKEVVKTIEVYGEFHRFLPALAYWRGFRVGEIPVTHHARRFGKSKFGASRFINGFLDLIAAMFLSRNALKPLHVFGRLALLTGGVGALINLYFLVSWLFGTPLRVRPVLVLGLVLVVVGIQLLLMGLLGEMIAAGRPKTDWPVRFTVNLDPEGDAPLDGSPPRAGAMR
jgi:glycosyltransferase involved in cell wall biosynthesis